MYRIGGGICLFTLNGNCFLHLFDFHPRAECSIYAFTLSKKKKSVQNFASVMQILATCLTTSQFCCLPFCQIADRDKNVLPQVRSCLQPLFSSGAGGTILNPHHPQSPNTHIYTHTHKRTFSTSTHNLMEPECRICSFTPRRLRKITAKRRDILQINFSPASEAYAKTKVP